MLALRGAVMDFTLATYVQLILESMVGLPDFVYLVCQLRLYQVPRLTP